MEDVDRLKVVMQTTRRDLLRLVSRGQINNYASALAKEVGIKHKICAFHLKTLERAGLVEGKFVLSGSDKKVAIKHFKITQKGKQILKHIDQLSSTNDSIGTTFRNCGKSHSFYSDRPNQIIPIGFC
jgi:predicted ArsR family transcriptional regulator